MQEVAVPDMDLGAVEAALPGKLGAASPPIHDLIDVPLLHGLRHLAVGGALDVRRTPEHTEIVRRVTRCVAAEVVELLEYHSPVLVHRGGQALVELDRAAQVSP